MSSVKNTRWLWNVAARLPTTSPFKQAHTQFVVHSAATSHETAIITMADFSPTDSFTFEILVNGGAFGGGGAWTKYERGGLVPTLSKDFPQLRFNEENTYKIVPVGAPSANCKVEFKEVEEEGDTHQPFSLLSQSASSQSPPQNDEPRNVFGCLDGRTINGIAMVNTATGAVTGTKWLNPLTNTWGALPAGAAASACGCDVTTPQGLLTSWG